MATDSLQSFALARRRDWRLVWQSHLLALPISALAFVGLCQAHPHVPLLLLPHFAYWTVASGLFVWVWPLSLVGVAGMVLAPIAVYRVVGYYRHGGSFASLERGLQGRWRDAPWYRRAATSLRLGLLPTRWLLRTEAARGRTELLFDTAEPPIRRPSLARWRVALALAISLHHLPFSYAVQVSLCARAPWTLQLPSWAGPCKASLGYAPGVRAFGCSELRK